jgi:hypothetical protein
MTTEENPLIAEKVKRMEDLQNLLDWFLDEHDKKEMVKMETIKR